MDILEILRNRVGSLDNADQKQHFQSIVRHIEAAEEHYSLASSGKEYAFSDVIYRTNQAFEGSLKEAYRVLAERDPESKSTYQIEEYLTSDSVLKPRVVSELANYRKEWRNKSTHDYTLVFDSSEALLAITYVSSFAVVLLGQVAETIARRKAKTESDDLFELDLGDIIERRDSLENSLAAILSSDIYISRILKLNSIEKNSDAIGTTAGYIEGLFPNYNVRSGFPIEQIPVAPDLLVNEDGVSAMVFVKPYIDTNSELQEIISWVNEIVGESGIYSVFMVLNIKNRAAVLWNIDGASGGRIHIVSNRKNG